MDNEIQMPVTQEKKADINLIRGSVFIIISFSKSNNEYQKIYFRVS